MLEVDIVCSNLYGLNVQTSVGEGVGSEPRLKEIFPVPPLGASKRPPNIKDKLIWSKVPLQTIQDQKEKFQG